MVVILIFLLEYLDVFSKIFIMIVDSLKKAKKRISYSIK